MKKRLRGLALCLGCVVAGAASADGVTRSVEPVVGGCKVTLSWEFSGKVESDLIIEERFAKGWLVDDATVPFGSLDASWFSGPVARFAVKPALLAGAGSISFTVSSTDDAVSGAATGVWKMYLDGALRTGTVSGQDELALVGASGGDEVTGGTGASGVTDASDAKPVAITSFKMTGEGVVLSYSGVTEAGVILVEGSEGLDKGWNNVKSIPVAAGAGSVAVAPAETLGSRFFRLKFMRGK